MNLDKILKAARRGGASDIILKVGSYPKFRHNGQLVSSSDGSPITIENMKSWISTIIPKHMSSKLTELEDLDFSYTSKDAYRYRVNLFRQTQSYGLVLRVINSHIKSMEELLLPKELLNIPHLKRGLVLVTGATGSGKSTTLASIVDKINAQYAHHIITIEDPIEYIFQDKKATVNQREIGIDVKGFAPALRSALRQDPDVILVGELRDKETTETALMAAETGHLVLATLHTANAAESLTRILSYFSPHMHARIKLSLSQTLEYVISQRLVTRKSGEGRVASLEILKISNLIKEQILKAENFDSINDAIKMGKTEYGMQTFDQSLIYLAENNIITKKEAIKNASNRQDMEMHFQGLS